MLSARWGVGSEARSTVALAVLVCGCVFAAVTGPALNLHTRTQALQQDLAAQGDTTQSVQASVAWSDWVGPSEQGGGPLNLLTVALLGYDGGEVVRRGLADFPLIVRSDYIPRIQEVQASIYHLIREALEGLRNG